MKLSVLVFAEKLEN